MEIVVALPGERTFLARGQVKHRTDTAADSRFFGVQFTSLSTEQRASLRRYIESRLSEEPGADARVRRFGAS